LVNFQFQTYFHNEFQTRGIEYLKGKGYEVMDTTYHNTFSEKAAAILQNMNYDITALYLKGWPDNWIIRDDFVAAIDWKTQEIERPNYSIEATSYAIHYTLAKIGIRVIYPYWDVFTKTEKGILLDKDKKFAIVGDTVLFPPQADKNIQTKTLQRDFLRDVFGEKLQFHNSKGGHSPDPFFIIKANIIKNLPDWKDLIP